MHRMMRWQAASLAELAARRVGRMDASAVSVAGLGEQADVAVENPDEKSIAAG